MEIMRRRHAGRGKKTTKMSCLLVERTSNKGLTGVVEIKKKRKGWGGRTKRGKFKREGSARRMRSVKGQQKVVEKYAEVDRHQGFDRCEGKREGNGV